MERRDFIAGIGATTAWPLAAAAQSDRIYRIALLNPGPFDTGNPFFNLFFKELRRHGLVEGQNLVVDKRGTGTTNFRIAAAEAVRRLSLGRLQLVSHSWLEDSMAEQVPPGATIAAAPSERRQVTVLFADMAGFTAISEQLGEEDTYALIRPIYELMAATVNEQGGSVKDFTGDGIMALFGVPRALEDAPLRACRAALLIQERLASAAPSFEARHGVRPQMRIGINTGLEVVTQIRSERTDLTALGDAVNLASRLQTIAKPGKVLLSEPTYQLVQGLVDASFAGEHVIKGKAELQKAYELESIRQGAARFDAALNRGLSAYVGRERELEILGHAFAEAQKRLQVVDIMAEPGMGKSRLLHEFRQRIDRDSAFILLGSCSPDGQRTPFLPFIEVVRGSFRVSAGEAEKEVARKLERGLTFLGLHSLQNLGLLVNLLGLEPPQDSLAGLDGVLIGLRTRELLQELLNARCRASQSGYDGRGPALDRQRLGRVTHHDHHWRGSNAALAGLYAKAGIRSAVA
jgi:class 3 adenylate cyclase